MWNDLANVFWFWVVDVYLACNNDTSVTVCEYFESCVVNMRRSLRFLPFVGTDLYPVVSLFLGRRGQEVHTIALLNCLCCWFFSLSLSLSLTLPGSLFLPPGLFLNLSVSLKCFLLLSDHAGVLKSLMWNERWRLSTAASLSFFTHFLSSFLFFSQCFIWIQHSNPLTAHRPPTYPYPLLKKSTNSEGKGEGLRMRGKRVGARW